MGAAGSVPRSASRRPVARLVRYRRCKDDRADWPRSIGIKRLERWIVLLPLASQRVWKQLSGDEKVSESGSENRYELSADSPLFILAMDHRASFGRVLFGVEGTPTEAELTKMRNAKMVIYEGASQATTDPLPTGRAGVLVDEELGADVARRAKADGFVLAMPIEKSGTELFELEYGDQFPEHVEAFDPDFSKVLVRYNPADGPDQRATQIERLAQVSTWAERTGRRWLFELLVPPTREQLAHSEDQFHFDRDVRPALTVETIGSFNDGGVHPTVWKLEGYETTEGAEQVLRAVAAETAFPAECIVLGRNAPMEQVEHWIDVAAPLPGFAGFAVGRSIWEEALQDLIAGRIERKQAVTVIADRYRRLIDSYGTARRPGARLAERSEPFTLQNPRLTPDREDRIRRSLQGADMRRTRLPAWMAATLLSEVDALRAEIGNQPPSGAAQ
jgi:myo-inositol catabolism protein IolC